MISGCQQFSVADAAIGRGSPFNLSQYDVPSISLQVAIDQHGLVPFGLSFNLKPGYRGPKKMTNSLPRLISRQDGRSLSLLRGSALSARVLCVSVNGRAGHAKRERKRMSMGKFDSRGGRRQNL